MKREEVALNCINNMQGWLKVIEKEKQKIEQKLADKGYTISYDYRPGTIDYVDRTTCYCLVHKTDEIRIRARAKLSDNDVEVELLGKYLALCRAADITLKGDDD